MVSLATSDCVGIELTDNKLYGGNGQFVSGADKPSVLRDNKAFGLGDAARPHPKVPSIYEWQQQHVQDR
jgi:hypothetical protein